MAMQPYISNDAARVARQRMLDHLGTLNHIREAVVAHETDDALAMLDGLIQDTESRIVGVDEMMQRMRMNNK